MPKTADLPAFDTQITEDVWIGKVRRLKLRIAVENSDRLPLDLYHPRSVASLLDVNKLMTLLASPKLAAVVALHPTGAAGKRIVAGEGESATK